MNGPADGPNRGIRRGWGLFVALIVVALVTFALGANVVGAVALVAGLLLAWLLRFITPPRPR